MFYLEIVKDCLYVEKADGHARRSVQTAYWHILDTLTRLMAPIFSFTAEQISDLYQKDKKESIHLQEFNLLKPVWEELTRENAALRSAESYAIFGRSSQAFHKVEELARIGEQKKRWDMLKSIRSVMLKETEKLREQNIIKRSLDAKITMFVDPAGPEGKRLQQFFDDLEDKGESVEQFFKDFAILSQFEFAPSPEGLTEAQLLCLNCAIACES